MRLITTNYLADVGNVEMANCRVYQTTCEDVHFTNIISTNVAALQGEFVDTSILYVLMDNENVEDTTNYYSSLSFKTRQRGGDIIYQVCIVTKEDNISTDLMRVFFTIVFNNLSLNNRIRIAFSTDPLETTYSIQSIEHIYLCVENMVANLGL